MERQTSETGAHSLQLRSVSHRYGDVTAVDEVSLDIGAGELVALLGPSGCGKTTLLRIIAGFVQPSAGDVCVDGRSVIDVPPTKRGIGIVFQNFALFPHMVVSENVAYGLKARRMERKRITETVTRMLELVRLGEMHARYPRELSGGQQQRVALARALAVNPRILLLDEPFGALDKNLRLDMQIELKKIQHDFGVTCILVTHDQEEALSMSDRVAVLRHGKVEQLAKPVEIYDAPASLFVSTFVGTSNLIRGEVLEAKGAELVVRLNCGTVVAARTSGRLRSGTRVIMSVRPEHFRIAEGATSDRLAGTINVIVPMGPTVIFEVGLNDGSAIKVTEPRHLDKRIPERGKDVHVTIRPDAVVSVFPEH